MTPEETARSDLAKILLLTVAWLFLRPVATLFIVGYMQRTQDTAFLARVDGQVAT